jgi:riboflavin kinase/FMN adenylyltransferase
MVATGAAAAIGNFDGVHRGHQRLLAETIAFARSMNAPSGAVVFDPHPRRYFRPGDPSFLLTTSAQREKLLNAHGAERVMSLAFDASLAAMSPEQFVREILKGRLGLAGVVTGTDFRFGKGRSGDAEGLRALCEAAGMEALLVEPKREADGEKIGSSAIRAALQSGDVLAAAAMLGRPWAVEGVVQSGQKLGRTLGFPTANMTLGDLVEPRRGVYAVSAIVDGGEHKGVANFGRRPTVGSPAPLLETHLFNFAGDLYGKTLEVRFVEFIRDEKKFDGLDALKAQIAADSRIAQRILG